jgi:hypothetical protein
MTTPRFNPDDMPDLNNDSAPKKEFSKETQEKANIMLDWVRKGQSVGPLIISQTVMNIDGPNAPILYDLGFSIGLISALFPACIKVYDGKDTGDGKTVDEHLITIFNTVMQDTFNKLGYDTVFLISIKKRQNGTDEKGSPSG